ncbi:transcriptional regulator [Leucobacter sp. Psy1]|uniref:ROK family transcriptional regulator n=1 Tax=Leucobacter sp. Psy1 TaxID=2875729 RepID=UPI001CD6CBA8|nr:ROK family transcriptional regulator [Leucobacter sp. Psy1]UBH05532.1 transcriptional regulator [Leucobacter sp. Psy1]
MTSPHSSAALRDRNRKLVFDALRSFGPSGEASQADVARHTSLAPATVSTNVRELEAAGLITVTAGAGRRGAVLRIDPGAGMVGGIDFGHSHVRVSLADLGGTITASATAPIADDHDSNDGLALANDLLDGLRAQADPSLTLHAMGVGLPAPIGANGVIDSGSILPGWVGIHAREAVQRRFGVPTIVDNDANLGALAEFAVGAGRPYSSVAFIKVSSGIGAGIVLDGHIFRGGIATAGELGHLTMQEDGPLCRCGSRGCLESYAGGASLVRQYRTIAPDLTVSEFVGRATDGDVGARRLIEDAGRHLGRAAASLAQILGPEAIVVGGDLAEAGDLLLDGVREGLRRHALESIAAHTAVVQADLADRSAAIGAVLMALEAVDV